MPHSSADTNDLDMFTQSENSSNWHGNASRVIDITNDSLTAELTHFSPYAVAKPIAGVSKQCMYLQKAANI